ncbi:uncharacterized protein LOC115483390 [Drosophila hydei]|uniref:Uncharacterized protein LOC115483390 n=1 Tax=Drosophila hydei TaxID=7224 RepID=A0A6J2SXW8_DROHY|nr:uncharacterized protein LOC115483390 [Drosophila hydei]
MAPYTMEFWTSGNNYGNATQFYWQSTGLLANYLPWADGSPNLNDGNCLTLYAATYANWGVANYRLVVRDYDYSCAHICEQQPQKKEKHKCFW